MRTVECQGGKMAALRAGLLSRPLIKGKTPRISEIVLGTRAGADLYTCHPPYYANIRYKNSFL